MKLETFKKIKMPDTPGVYFFMKGREILYIGKATCLRDRVKSYFSKDLIATRSPVILDMVFNADDIKWQPTDSVLEALILEAELIKKHQPKGNTREKDDKSWNYVCFTKEEAPKIKVIRGKDLKNYTSLNFSPLRPSLGALRGPKRDPRAQKIQGDSVFGPYTNGTQLKEALRIIRRIFPFIDESSSKRANAQFYRQLQLTPENMEEYKRNIRHLKLFFRGKKKEIIRNLKKEMKAEAKNRNFEMAAKIRNQIFALKHINDVSLLKTEPRANTVETFRIEAYDIAHLGGRNMVGVMTVVEDGLVNKNEYRKFKIRTQSGANDTGALGEVLDRRIGHPEWPYPNLIVVDGSTAQINAASGVLKKSGIDIPVVAVVKDERHKPMAIKGDKDIINKNERVILLANSEAHRFAITYHKNMRGKSFLPGLKKRAN
jgi:excinuclease ABC subunit C